MAFDIGTSTKTSTGGSYQNQYDLKRQNIREEEQKRQKQEQAALQRALASRGFSAGSGFAEANQRNLASEQRAEEKSRLSEVDTSQLAAAEEAEKTRQAQQYQTREREAAQTYQTGERLGTQAFQTGEREAAQKYEGGFRQQEIDNAATQFASQLDFDYWATQSGYTNEEKQRAWQERQNTMDRNAQAIENEAQRSYNWDLTQLQNQLTQSNMTLQETLANNTAALKNRVDLLYTAGQNAARGGPAYDTSNLSQQEQDAYELGRLGIAKEEADRYYEDLSKYNAALVTTAAEDEDVIKKMVDMWQQYFGTVYPGYTNPIQQQSINPMNASNTPSTAPVQSTRSGNYQVIV